MSEMMHNIAILIAGIVIGIFFFGALWYTVKKALPSSIPALWFFCSFIIRTGITVFGFYFVAAGSMQSLLLCTIGFVLARFVVTYHTKSSIEKQSQPSNIIEYED